MPKQRSTDERFVTDCLVGAAGGGVAGAMAMCLTMTAGSGMPAVLQAQADPGATMLGLFVLHISAAMLGALMGGMATALISGDDT